MPGVRAPLDARTIRAASASHSRVGNQPKEPIEPSVRIALGPCRELVLHFTDYQSLRDKVLLLVGEAHCQPPRRQLRNLQCQSNDLAADIVGDAIPDTIWSGTVVSQRLRAAFTISVIPAVERSAGDAEFVQGALGRQMRLLDKLDDLGLLGCRISHASSSPSPLMLFLSRRFSRVRSATTSFKAAASRRRSFTSPDVAARAVSPASRRLPASRNSFDQP